MHPILLRAGQTRPETVNLIRSLVECESPSDSPPHLSRFLDLLVEQTREIAKPKQLRCGEGRACLRLDFHLPGSGKNGQILGLGHADTVWPLGTLEHMPYRKAKGRLWGPGVLDMKSGLAFFIAAARLLRDLDIAVSRKVRLLVVPDEETGSLYSRPLTEAEAQRSEAVLVLEPGTGLTGKLKTARKGVGRYTITVRGVAAHAGVDFKEGASAVLELANQIQHICELTDLPAGITVNPGVIRGGTRANVIAAEASVEVDLRVVKSAQAIRIDRNLRSLSVKDERCKIHIEGGVNRPPMERKGNIRRLYARACSIAKEIGLTVEESSTGGASDGNFTAALGIATLDGLGGVGEGAHAENESILIDRIDDRVALLAGLLAGL